MSPDDLDRILAAEGTIVPSPGFVASVMEAVRREAATPPPIAFPWRRLVPGLAACAALAVITVLLAPPPPISEPELQALAARMTGALSGGIGRALLWTALALLGSYLAVRYSLRAAEGID